MSSTDVAVRKTFDLTRAPDADWNKEMIEMVTKQVFRGQEMTLASLHYCLVVADSLNLNPMIGEVYFIPSKSTDGKGPTLTPYVGRNGLVKKASEKDAYYESETVHAADRFRMTRKGDGTVTVTHSYGSEDRGEIVGAYAFLHFRNGDKPAFFYAKIGEYRPTFDQDWKMQKSPWGNQTSAMIEKCAMIGAGRKRLDLGNVLADGEIARVQQMAEIGPRSGGPELPPAEFDFETLTQNPKLAGRLRFATLAHGWPAAKCDMTLSGRSDVELEAIVTALEADAESLSAGTDSADAQEGQGEPERPQDAGSVDETAQIKDADVVAPLSAEEEAHADALRARITSLEDRLSGVAPDSEEAAALTEEIETVGHELGALGDPNQTSLEV